MKKIFLACTALVFTASLIAQKTFEDPILEMPKGTVFVFEEDYVIPPNSESIKLSEGIILHIHPSKNERRISSTRTFTVKGVEDISRHKGGVAASLWAYVYFVDPNIKHLEIYLGDRNEKGFVESANAVIGDVDASKYVKLSLPDIEEF